MYVWIIVTSCIYKNCPRQVTLFIANGEVQHYTNESCICPLPIVHCSTSSVAVFLGVLVVHTVGFKRLWWLFTGRHLATNCHMTAYRCYPLIWLLLWYLEHKWTIFGAISGSQLLMCLAHNFVAPLYRDHLCMVLVKNYSTDQFCDIWHVIHKIPWYDWT